MRFLGAVFVRVLDWALLGGFGRFVYKTLATGFGFCTVAEIWTNGFTDWAYTSAFLTVGMLVALYGDDFF